MEFHKIKGVLWLQIFSGKIMYVYFDFQNKKISFQRPPVKLIHCLKVWKLHPIMRSMLLKIQKNNLLQISKCTCTLSQDIYPEGKLHQTPVYFWGIPYGIPCILMIYQMIVYLFYFTASSTFKKFCTLRITLLETRTTILWPFFNWIWFSITWTTRFLGIKNRFVQGLTVYIYITW